MTNTLQACFVFDSEDTLTVFGDYPCHMGSKQELIWHVSGTVVETIYNLGNRGKPYWQVVVAIDDGFVCLYARNDEMRPIAENLSIGQKIEASGKVKPRKAASEAKRPIFLDPVEQLSPID